MTSVTQVASEQLYVHNDSARIEKLFADQHPCMRALRLYCVQHNSVWMLQIRAPVSLANGKNGSHSYMANVRLNLKEAEELHTKLGEFIGEMK